MNLTAHVRSKIRGGEKSPPLFKTPIFKNILFNFLNNFMTLFTKEQAIAIREKVNHLIGQPFDDELKITNIWIIPKDQDYEFIIKQYQFNNATSKSIAETYGNGQNLMILALSSDLLHVSSWLPVEHISRYLSKD
ncbi:MAG: hypothetical protein WBB93_02955, partial [Saprospiraceae bacterium]